MILEEACRLLDPYTTAEELAKIEYYNGFNGKRPALRPSTKPVPCWWISPAAIARRIKSKWIGFVDF